MAKRNLFSKLLSIRPVEIPPDTPTQLKFVIFITDWNRAHAVSDVLDEYHVRFHFVTRGIGTASSEILDILGIGTSDKAVTFCLEQAALFPVLMKEARKKLGFNNPGQGIAFTIPLSAINDPVLLAFKKSSSKNDELSPAAATAEGDKGVNMAKEFSYDLIVSIVDHGYSEEVMNAARAAGATGGTVLHARGQTHEGVVRFFGISVQDEKDIILILTNRAKKVDIMRAVSEAFGLNSKAHGIVFSLPAEDVVGMVDLE